MFRLHVKGGKFILMKDIGVHFLHRFLAVTYLLDNLISARLYLNVCSNKALSFQNELIIQIMTESHEIDNLKRKVEDAKMKLLTEIKVQILDSFHPTVSKTCEEK